MCFTQPTRQNRGFQVKNFSPSQPLQPLSPCIKWSFYCLALNTESQTVIWHLWRHLSRACHCGYRCVFLFSRLFQTSQTKPQSSLSSGRTGRASRASMPGYNWAIKWAPEGINQHSPTWPEWKEVNQGASSHTLSISTHVAFRTKKEKKSSFSLTFIKPPARSELHFDEARCSSFRIQSGYKTYVLRPLANLFVFG